MKESAWNALKVLSCRRLFRARRPGLGKIRNNEGWSAFVRVSRRAFVGRSIFRHLAEEDGEG